MTLETYIGKVNWEIIQFSNGVFDLDDMVDFADGEASISECHADEVSPKECARRVLAANGWAV